MEVAELAEVIEKHRKWLNDEEGGERANLCGADLSNANLSGKNLALAYLRGADLRGANLSGALLRGADLDGAFLSGADLSGVTLFMANLRLADLIGANLSGAILSETNLMGADLSGANLHNVNILQVDFSLAKNGPDLPMECPSEGEYVAYKKASNKIVVLLVPSDAKRSSATNKKCRASKAKVLRIENLGGSDSGLLSVASDYNNTFVYAVGQEVTVPDFDENRWNECAPGIHHFMKRKDAVRY